MPHMTNKLNQSFILLQRGSEGAIRHIGTLKRNQKRSKIIHSFSGQPNMRWRKGGGKENRNLKKKKKDVTLVLYCVMWS